MNMMSPGVKLTSEVFSNQLIKTVGDLFENNILTDVTLVCDDRVKIEAHKVVLSAGSNLFRDFFMNHTHSHPLMFLKGIKHYQLQPLIQFLYHGEVTISQNIIDEILTAAKSLELTELNSDSSENELGGGSIEVSRKDANEFDESNLHVYDNDAIENKIEATFAFEEPNRNKRFIKELTTESCDQCQFKCNSQTGLRNHMAFVHRNVETEVRLNNPETETSL